MIPQLVTFRYRRSDGRLRRWFIPVVPVAVLLSPLLLITAVGGLIACLMFHVHPGRALVVLWRVMWALPGSRVEIDDGRTALHLIVR